MIDTYQILNVEGYSIGVMGAVCVTAAVFSASVTQSTARDTSCTLTCRVETCVHSFDRTFSVKFWMFE
jgi:hypothetical protein